MAAGRPFPGTAPRPVNSWLPLDDVSEQDRGGGHRPRVARNHRTSPSSPQYECRARPIHSLIMLNVSMPFRIGFLLIWAVPMPLELRLLAQARLWRSCSPGAILDAMASRVLGLQLLRGRLYLARGQVDAARTQSEIAAGMARHVTEPWLHGSLQQYLAELAAYQGDYAAARSAIVKGLRHQTGSEEILIAMWLCNTGLRTEADAAQRDRKSTRLNSSHVRIS